MKMSSKTMLPIQNPGLALTVAFALGCSGFASSERDARIEAPGDRADAKAEDPGDYFDDGLQSQDAQGEPISSDMHGQEDGQIAEWGDAWAELQEGTGDALTQSDGGDACKDGADEDTLISDTTINPPPLFDLEAIRDKGAAQCSFSEKKTVWQGLTLLDVYRLSYMSYEVVDGKARPIQIRAFAARPQGNVVIPGVVFAHGLGGFAEESNATGLAALLGAFVVAYTGPGGGKPDDAETQSEGIPPQDPATGSFYRLFDTVPDPRGSWIWAHAVAAMRAITCLETRADVDHERLGIMGASAGAMVSLIAAGVDDRIKVSLPMSGTGAFDIASASPNAWQHMLLSASGLSTSSPQWQAFLDHIDPIVHVPSTKAAILLLNGSSDEFFPLTAHVATYNALPTLISRRTSLVANYDHGCYAVAGVEPKEKIEERLAIRSLGNAKVWFQHHFSMSNIYAVFPQEPRLSLEPAGTVALAIAQVDPCKPPCEIERVSYWFSNDDAYTFFEIEMERQAQDIYGAVVLAPQDNTIYFVDVQYQVKLLFSQDRFAISSVPYIPEGLIPKIRFWGTCL